MRGVKAGAVIGSLLDDGRRDDGRRDDRRRDGGRSDDGIRNDSPLLEIHAAKIGKNRFAMQY